MEREAEGTPEASETTRKETFFEKQMRKSEESYQKDLEKNRGRSPELLETRTEAKGAEKEIREPSRKETLREATTRKNKNKKIVANNEELLRKQNVKIERINEARGRKLEKDIIKQEGILKENRKLQVETQKAMAEERRINREFRRPASSTVRKKEEAKKAKADAAAADKKAKKAAKPKTSGGKPAINTSTWDEWGKAMEKRSADLFAGKPSAYVTTPKVDGVDVPNVNGDGVGSKSWKKDIVTRGNQAANSFKKANVSGTSSGKQSLYQRLKTGANKNVHVPDFVKKGGKLLKGTAKIAAPIGYTADLLYGESGYRFQQPDVVEGDGSLMKAARQMGALGGNLVDWQPTTLFSDPLSFDWLPTPDQNVRQAAQDTLRGVAHGIKGAHAFSTGQPYQPGSRELNETEEFQPMEMSPELQTYIDARAAAEEDVKPAAIPAVAASSGIDILDKIPLPTEGEFANNPDNYPAVYDQASEADKIAYANAKSPEEENQILQKMARDMYPEIAAKITNANEEFATAAVATAGDPNKVRDAYYGDADRTQKLAGVADQQQVLRDQAAAAANLQARQKALADTTSDLPGQTKPLIGPYDYSVPPSGEANKSNYPSLKEKRAGMLPSNVNSNWNRDSKGNRVYAGISQYGMDPYYANELGVDNGINPPNPDFGIGSDMEKFAEPDQRDSTAAWQAYTQGMANEGAPSVIPRAAPGLSVMEQRIAQAEMSDLKNEATALISPSSEENTSQDKSVYDTYADSQGLPRTDPKLQQKLQNIIGNPQGAEDLVVPRTLDSFYREGTDNPNMSPVTTEMDKYIIAAMKNGMLSPRLPNSPFIAPEGAPETSPSKTAPGKPSKPSKTVPATTAREEAAIAKAEALVASQQAQDAVIRGRERARSAYYDNPLNPLGSGSGYGDLYRAPNQAFLNRQRG